MADVAEVTALPPVTRLPGAPAWLAGVANWRGRMLPVLDIRTLVGVPVMSPDRDIDNPGGSPPFENSHQY